MALSTHVPKEITEYKERLVGDFSGRQIACIFGVIATIASTYFVLVHFLNMSMDIYPYIAAFLCAPIILFGFYKKNEIPFEQYFLILIRHYFWKSKLPWSAEIDFPLPIEREDTNAKKKWKQEKKPECQYICQPQAAKKRRKAIQKKIKAAKKEYRAAKRSQKTKA